jgi:hypothetical protein
MRSDTYFGTVIATAFLKISKSRIGGMQDGC